MTRLDLTNNIMAWVHRIGFRSPVANFDAVSSFIELAEEDINDKLRAREMVTRVTQPVTGQYLTLPCDFIEAFDVRLENGPELTYQPRGQLATTWWARTVQAPGDPAWSGYAPAAVPWNDGQPTFYSVVGSQMELSPWPDNAAGLANVPNLELAYYQRQTLGPDDTDTTVVLSTMASIYLYGALLQAAPFLRDDPRIATWGPFYQGRIDRANAAHERARWQGTRLRAQYRRLA